MPDVEKWLDESFWEQGAFITCPESGLITLGKKGKIVVQRNLDESDGQFFLKDFFHSRFYVFRPKEILQVPKDLLLTSFKKNYSGKNLMIKKSFHRDEDLYEADFNHFKTREDLEKVVLLSREHYELSSDLASFLLSSYFFEKSLTFGSGLPYGFWGADLPFNMIGSTPEILYSLKENQLFTYALAGTSTDGEKLLQSPKDLHEHDIVVKDIKEKLSPLTKHLNIGKTYLHPFKDLFHLRTDVSGELHPQKGFFLQNIVDALTPTAALGGYPREKTQHFLKNSHYHQHYPDRFFGSSFGLKTQDQSFSLVAIRNIEWKGSDAFIESGGGVVHESEFTKELAEIKLKRNVIKNHFLSSFLTDMRS